MTSHVLYPGSFDRHDYQLIRTGFAILGNCNKPYYLMTIVIIADAVRRVICVEGNGVTRLYVGLC